MWLGPQVSVAPTQLSKNAIEVMWPLGEKNFIRVFDQDFRNRLVELNLQDRLKTFHDNMFFLLKLFL